MKQDEVLQEATDLVTKKGVALVAVSWWEQPQCFLLKKETS